MITNILNNTSLSKFEAHALLLTLTEAESSALPGRIAQLATELDDLGKGMRHALNEIARARARAELSETGQPAQ